MISLVDRRPAWRRGPTATPPIGAQTPGRNHRPRKKPRRSDPTSSPPSLSDGRLPQKAFQSQSFSRAKTPYPGYEDFVVQDLVLRPHVVRIRRERWLTPDGQTVLAQMPAEVAG